MAGLEPAIHFNGASRVGWPGESLTTVVTGHDMRKKSARGIWRFFYWPCPNEVTLPFSADMVSVQPCTKQDCPRIRRHHDWLFSQRWNSPVDAIQMPFEKRAVTGSTTFFEPMRRANSARALIAASESVLIGDANAGRVPTSKQKTPKALIASLPQF
jgi:hypothetical protein